MISHFMQKINKTNQLQPEKISNQVLSQDKDALLLLSKTETQLKSFSFNSKAYKSLKILLKGKISIVSTEKKIFLTNKTNKKLPIFLSPRSICNFYKDKNKTT